MLEKIQKKKTAVLTVLKQADKPLGSLKITEELRLLGYEVSERTVRLYLKELDGEGFTEKSGQRRRRITERGLRELEVSKIIDRVGFLSAKIDQMTYGMNFDLKTKMGTVVVNITLVPPERLAPCISMITKVFEYGYAMGSLAALLVPGERVGHIVVPEGMLGIGTVCSITLNGVLLKYGIPTNSRFGGLMEIQERKPLRFVEIINYDGTSIDPLEVFIRSGMTNYLGAVTTGSGRIGASFREFPAQSRLLVEELAESLASVGLGGFMSIGRPGQPLMEIPVSEGRVGAVVIGGLNPVAILEETGVRVYSRALAGFIEFSRLFHFRELKQRVNDACR